MDKDSEYKLIKHAVMQCKDCDLGECIQENNDPHVMGVGNLNAKIMFVAEAPGLQETIYKCPLTSPGTSGKIYERVLKELGLKRENVFTSNTVLCRPPNNRDPEPFEIVRCSKYLDAQIKIVNPNIIVTFGAHAGRAILGEDLGTITKSHGRIMKSKKYNVDIFPLYHPAYIGAYASISKRQEFKQDIKFLKKLLTERDLTNA